MIEQGNTYGSDEISSADAVEHWDRAAQDFTQFFAEGEELYHKRIINPCLLDVLGNVEGKKVCDLACGEGHFARSLAKRAGGNIDIVCVDASREMIRIAQERTESHESPLRFLVADASDLGDLASASFDVVVCNMAIMDIADYLKAIHEVARILTPEGAFVFSILHPCFMTPGSGWIKTDPESKDPSAKVGWKVDNYHRRLVQKCKIKPDMQSETYYFHRTLEDYFAALRQNSFVVTDLREPVPSEEMLAADPGSRPDLKTSAFLVIKAVKTTLAAEQPHSY